jgi:hypothetical protein
MASVRMMHAWPARGHSLSLRPNQNHHARSCSRISYTPGMKSAHPWTWIAAAAGFDQTELLTTFMRARELFGKLRSDYLPSPCNQM